MMDKLDTQDFHVVYRISDKGYNPGKLKVPNATKEHCLQNAVEQFGRKNISVIADNCSEGLVSSLKAQNFRSLEETHLGNSKSFKYAITQVINSSYNDSDIIYFCEDDYLHLPGSMDLIREGLGIADYVTLYDHPDQYMSFTLRRRGAGPLNRWGLHRWRIFLTEHSHWKELPTTTMTFAARAKTLKEDYKLLMKNPDSGVPDDFNMFLRLTKQRSLVDAVKVLPMWRSGLLIFMNNFAPFRKKRLLISCIPGRATHCENKWLSPLTDWTKI